MYERRDFTVMTTSDAEIIPGSLADEEQEEQVVLVDEQDRPIGVSDKLAAHRRGLLHRAFSVVLENERGELLLQRRAAHKYHSPGLWSNACCGHPRPGEAVDVAARRRVGEELGVDVSLRELGSFRYRAHVGDLTEHELDHVFVGRLAEEPRANPAEVAECRWVTADDLMAAMNAAPDNYTVWLPGVMSVVKRR
jgi:isopentenyl-diphosphate Delta-isomerase